MAKDSTTAKGKSPQGIVNPPPKGKHIFGTVRMGEKGQIVIPKAARDLFGLKAGSSVLVLGDEASGIALITDTALSNLITMAMNGTISPDMNMAGIDQNSTISEIPPENSSK